jgi:Domain of unknown function (DUF6431)
MIVFIPQTWPPDNYSRSADFDTEEWLPRICPACGQPGVIGHGRRSKQAHDENHTRIRVRRGRCVHCQKTFTVLPAWSLPSTHYSLRARQQSLTRVAAGACWEEASPPMRDADRIADPATLRRWCQRRLASLCGATALQQVGKLVGALLAPTILAWDCLAVAGILIPEAKPA